jgi:oligopeptide/dipeptide ABC transporter ATP-binding protein
MTLALSIDGLSVWYGGEQAVYSVSLEVPSGSVVALIGETGSGKSSVALAAARLLPPRARADGRVLVAGEEISALSGAELRRLRGEKVGFVTQDALAGLNPVMRVGRQIAEIFQFHGKLNRREAARKTVESIDQVRIPEPAAVARLYPHQLSGGMRQRIMIAIALALRPPVVIADEPTTALDVSTQAEILRLVRELCSELGTGILWITHDMGVVAEVADLVAVMYAGRIVEHGSAASVFDRQQHPYTRALLHTLHDMRVGQPGDPLFQIEGQPPSLNTLITGCPFHPRCALATSLCAETEPRPRRLGGDDAASSGLVSCHHAGEDERALL